MTKKFHIALFCPSSTYPEKQAFYTSIFGAPSHEGTINDGSDGHSYEGSIWTTEGLCFALLKDPNSTGDAERLAHVGIIFETGAEFDAEIQKRKIEPQLITVLSAGQRQSFAPDKGGVEWEFSCLEPQ